jgi:hypothetical protein
MDIKISLRWKLILAALALVILPAVLISGFALFQFSIFSEYTVKKSYSQSRQDSLRAIEKGVAINKMQIEEILNNSISDLKVLSSSSLLRSYIEAKKGKNKFYNSQSEAKVREMLREVAGVCASQEKIIKKNL